MNLFRYILLALSLLLIVGCQQQNNSENAPPATPDSKSQVVDQKPESEPPLASRAAERFEVPAQALTSWRKHRDKQPRLVLFSIRPMLQPVPDALRQENKQLTLNGTESELYKRGSYFRPNPAILAEQTVAAALDAGLFSSFTWIFPFPEPLESLNLESFLEQAVSAGIFSSEAAASMKVVNGKLQGTVGGTPIQVLHLDQLSKSAEPVVVHIDLSFFKGMFRDGVKTPVYDLLHKTATSIKAAGWNSLATTLCYSTEDGGLSLDTRFLIDDLAELIEDPALLEAMPRPWQLRADAMGARSIAQNQKALEYYQLANQLNPEVASTHFDLYRINSLLDRTTEALPYLHAAVDRDKAYALAYFEQLQSLSNTPENLAVIEDLQQRIVAAFPDNPFFLLQYVEFLLVQNRPAEALNYLEQLDMEPWSLHHHPQLPSSLARLKQMAGEPAENPAGYFEKN